MGKTTTNNTKKKNADNTKTDKTNTNKEGTMTETTEAKKTERVAKMKAAKAKKAAERKALHDKLTNLLNSDDRKAMNAYIKETLGIDASKWGKEPVVAIIQKDLEIVKPKAKASGGTKKKDRTKWEAFMEDGTDENTKPVQAMDKLFEKLGADIPKDAAWVERWQGRYLRIMLSYLYNNSKLSKDTIKAIEEAFEKPAKA